MKYVHYYPRALSGNGGPTVAMWSWVKALNTVGADVTVLYDEQEEAAQPLAVDGVVVKPLKHRLFGRWRYPVGIKKLLDPNSVVIVHSAFLFGNLYIAIIAKKIGAKVIFVPHGAYSSLARRQNAFLKKLWLFFERRIVNQSFAVHAFVETEITSLREICPDVPILVSPTPVDISADKKWIGGGGYIAWFGRYDIQHKGLDILIDAYSQLPDSCKVPLRMRGRDSKNTMQEILELVNEARLSEFISVEGPVEGREKDLFLINADLFVMPSRWESFSIALLEVLAIGVPSIVSENMPIAWHLKSEKACVVSPILPSDLAREIEIFVRKSKEGKLDLSPRDYVNKNLSYSAIGLDFTCKVKEILDNDS